MPRGCHIVTRELLKQLPEISDFEVGLQSRRPYLHSKREHLPFPCHRPSAMSCKHIGMSAVLRSWIYMPGSCSSQRM